MLTSGIRRVNYTSSSIQVQKSCQNKMKYHLSQLFNNCCHILKKHFFTSFLTHTTKNLNKIKNFNFFMNAINKKVKKRNDAFSNCVLIIF